MNETSPFQTAVRNWLLHEIDVQKVSRKRIASHLNLGASAVTRLLTGERQISAEELFRLAAGLGYPSSFNDLIRTIAPDPVAEDPSLKGGVRLSQIPVKANRDENGTYHNPLRTNNSSALRSRLPITASSAGSEYCDLFLNFAVEQTVIRPPSLSKLENYIATRMRGLALEPRHKHDEIVILQNARTLEVGMAVFCELPQNAEAVSAIPMRVGEISDLSETNMVLRHASGRAFEIDLGEILSIYAILDWNTVFGVIDVAT